MKTFLLAVCLGEGNIVVHGWRGSHVRCNDRNSCAGTTFWSMSIASSNSNSNSLASNLNALPMGEADVCFRRGAELEKIGQVRALRVPVSFALSSICVNIYSKVTISKS